jgi:5-methylcytosine-specific restriction endonuclease McrA
MNSLTLCKCGCGGAPSKGKTFIHGHNNRVKGYYRRPKGIASPNKGKALYDRDEVMRVYTTGLDCINTAKEIGCSSQTVRRYLKSAGVKVRGGFFGKKHTQEALTVMSEKAKKSSTKFKGREKHWNWKGGCGKHDYDDLWDEAIRKAARDRDGNKCVLCGVTNGNNHGFALSVHHIDGNKLNTNLDNLITYCNSCHMKEHAKMRRIKGNRKCLGA